MRQFALTIVVSVAMASTALACDTCKKNYSFGPPVVVGQGMAWTWVKLDPETKKPVSVGLTMTETALQGLPTEPPQGMVGIEYMLELPKEIKGLPYDHVTFDWNPKGHIPKGIYDRPHFDLHFFTLGEEDRKKMTLEAESVKKAQKAPDKQYVPEGYIMPPGTYEPNMGTHWVHPQTPELHGQPFTHTFIYGSYDGRTAFIEPMFTYDLLASKAEVKQDVKQPLSYQQDGYYPATYRISYDEKRKEFSISMEGLVFRRAGETVAKVR